MKSSKHIPLLLCLCYYEQCFVILIVFMDNLRANTVSIFEFFLHMSLQSDNQSFQTSDRCWLNIQIASTSQNSVYCKSLLQMRIKFH